MGTTDIGKSTELRRGRIETRSPLPSGVAILPEYYDSPGCDSSVSLLFGPIAPARATPLRVIRVASGLAVLCALVACAPDSPPSTPRDTLDEYANALSSGRAREAYALLSDETQKAMPYEAFERMVRENPEEVKNLASALRRPAGPPVLTAVVAAPSGEELLLVYEGGAWRVDGASIDLYGQATPKAAIAAFVRAFENKRWDVLLRFVPDAESEGLDAKKLQTSFEGEQKEEMERLTQALRAALPTAQIETLGDRATMAYGAGGTVELKREHGAWKIEELK